jgi:tRNA (cmo5U34)-methyltransferase
MSGSGDRREWRATTTSLHGMADSADTNAAIWKSDEVVAAWSAEAADRERLRGAHRRFMSLLLPFDPDDAFTFLDIGAGTGAASREILTRYSRSTAILADFSPQMMGEGEREMAPFAGRYTYVEFDAAAGAWPSVLPVSVDAVVTSLFVHHLADDRKWSLFGEIFDRLVPGGWYLNYDPITSPDPVTAAAWQRTNERIDPATAAKHAHRTHQEQQRWENHVRYMIPLAAQLAALRAAGFHGVDVYWQQLENVIYGGCRPG